jgi:hypothetical protein
MASFDPIAVAVTPEVEEEASYERGVMSECGDVEVDN